jgi:hypothetical protein
VRADFVAEGGDLLLDGFGHERILQSIKRADDATGAALQQAAVRAREGTRVAARKAAECARVPSSRPASMRNIPLKSSPV